MTRRSAPPPSPVALVCPPHLNTAARAEWDRIVSALSALNLLRNVDSTALGAYCDCYSVWVKACEALKDGWTFTSETGYTQARPEVAIRQKALDQMRAFMSEFGMTPAARTRMRIEVAPPQRDPNPFDGLASSPTPTPNPRRRGRSFDSTSTTTH